MDEMMFPYNWEGFLGDYSFIDHREFYTNGARLIPTFRVEQLVEHYFAPDNNVGHKWISVTERLPEVDELVIAFCKIGKIFVGFRRKYYSGRWGWVILTARDSTKDITQTVTHWMPLPKPPKEEDNGKE